MNSLELLSTGIEQTLDIGERLGRGLRPGDCLALVGPLGAGKTLLVRGLARGAGVADLRQVTSPTFVLVNEYEASAGSPPLIIHHVDAYRLRDGRDLEALGFEELLSEGAVVVEWADRVADCLPADHLCLCLSPISGNERRIVCTPTGPRSRELLTCLQ